LTAEERKYTVSIQGDPPNIADTIDRIVDILDTIPGKSLIATFQERVEDLYKRAAVTVIDDLQKNRWGGKATVIRTTLKAVVGSAEKGGFHQLDISVSAGEDSAGKDSAVEQQVAFFSQGGFDDEEISYQRMRNGVAQITLHALRPFTIGAYTGDGKVLELDLRKVKGLPSTFREPKPAAAFVQKVQQLLEKRPITVIDDPQKGRWGGHSEWNGRRLSATIRVSLIPNLYIITAEIIATNTIELKGDNAFLIHAALAEKIYYRRAIDGLAAFHFVTPTLFTIGAYTEDNIVLELDLSTLKPLQA
jgi:hypothetical protein